MDDDLDAIFDGSDDEDGDPEYDFMNDNPSLLASLSGMFQNLLFQKVRNYFLGLNLLSLSFFINILIKVMFTRALLTFYVLFIITKSVFVEKLSF